jgi:hypothetical protein
MWNGRFEQIAEDKTVAVDDLAAFDRNCMAENGPIENERVEFAILTAWIHIRRQVGKKFGSQLAASETAIQFSRIDADSDGAKP